MEAILVVADSKAENAHYKRVSATLELYASIISRSKQMLEEQFQIKPQTVLHDGERRQVIDVAKDIFRVTVTEKVLDEIVASMPNPIIETVMAEKQEVGPHDAAPGQEKTTPGAKVAGF